MAAATRPASPAAMDAAYRTLARAVADLTDGQKWAGLLRLAARHHGQPIAVIYALAVHRPDATHIATYDGWREHGRHVGRGERGIATLVPHPGRADKDLLVTVFDITQTSSQTSGPTGPATPQVSADRAAYLLAAFAADDLTVRTRPGLVARVRVDGDRMDLAPDAHPHEIAVHAARHLAQQLLGYTPAALRDLVTESVVQVVAARFGITTAPVAFPAPIRWASAHTPHAPHGIITLIAGRVFELADQISQRILDSQRRPADPKPAPVPTTAPAKDHITDDVSATGAATAEAVAVDVRVLRAVHSRAAEFFAAQLPGQRAAAAYLTSRGIAATATDPPWQLGYAPPGGHALRDHLRQLGFSDQVQLAAGVVMPLRGSGQLRDRWVNRLMFPIHDTNADVVAFIGRDLSAAAGPHPKWVNSPQTPLYHKSQVLYGLGPQLGRRIPTDAQVQVVVVEGPADVHAARRIYAGLQDEGTYTIAVAPCGTAFTGEQRDLLAASLADRRPHLILAFDSDTAGAKAFDRAYELVRSWPYGTVRALAPLPAKDPAELLAAQGPANALLTVLAAERPLAILGIDHALDRAAEHTSGGKLDPQVPEDLARALAAVTPYVIGSGAPTRQAVRHIAVRLGVDVGRAVQGITAAFEARHGLDPDQTGPAPGRSPPTPHPGDLTSASFTAKPTAATAAAHESSGTAVTPRQRVR